MSSELIEALEKLSLLREQGALSDSEFRDAKAALFSLRNASLSNDNKFAKQSGSLWGANPHGGLKPIVVYDHPSAPKIPDDEVWLLRFSGGRVKGRGLSLSGIELMTLAAIPPDLVVYGRYSNEIWRKPLRGMTAQKQGIDAVMFTAKDGESIRWIAAVQHRAKLIATFDRVQTELAHG